MRNEVRVGLVALLLLAALLYAGPVFAQTSFINLNGLGGGYTIITPGQRNGTTFVNPNGVGGFTAITPGARNGTTFVNPNGLGGFYDDHTRPETELQLRLALAKPARRRRIAALKSQQPLTTGEVLGRGARLGTAMRVSWGKTDGR